MNNTGETLLNNLQEALEAKDENRVLKILREPQLQLDDIKLTNNKSIPLSIVKFNNEKVTEQFLEVAAEWSKSEENRKILENKDIIDFLMKFLQNNNEQTILNVVRLLGNICYENESAQLHVGTKGLNILIDLLRNDRKHKTNTLTLKTSGFLVNLLSSNENLQKDALKLDIIQVIKELLEKYLDKLEENETLFIFLLTILNIVQLHNDELSIPFPQDLCLLVVEIFKLSKRLEVSVSCFEILYDLIENDEIKLLLAKNGVCELIIDLIKQHQKEVTDEEKRSFMKQACDAIVVILTEDNCMNLLYNNGKGRVYEDMINWLQNEDPDLLSTAVLALGNFARKDSNCVQMVKDGISKKLIDLLSSYNKTDSDIKVQHALLSTLKNLAILKANKQKIIEDGLIDVIYPLIQSEQYVVIFKLLGLFRIATEGQESTALDLITRKDFLEKLMYWCIHSDHPGVRSEVPRLLSWLIKHSHSSQPYKDLIKTKDVIKSLVEMISAPHALMQNEAFQSLHILLNTCIQKHSKELDNKTGSDGDLNSQLYDKLIQAEIGKHLEFVIKKYGNEMLVENILILLEDLCKIPKILEHLKCHSLHEICSKFLDNSNAAGSEERINSLIRNLND